MMIENQDYNLSWTVLLRGDRPGLYCTVDHCTELYCTIQTFSETISKIAHMGCIGSTQYAQL